MVSSIRDSINQRDLALVKFKHSEDNTDFDRFKILRNQTKEKIRTAKKNYFADTIKENKKDTSKLWKILKQLGCGGGDANHRSTEPNVGLSTEGGIEFDSNKVATIFNNFFTSIASKLVSSLPPKSDQYGEDFVSTFYRERGVMTNSFSLNKVTVFKVTKILSELNIKKATGIDGVSARFLRDTACTIAPVVTHIFNLSIEKSMFPTEFKNAKVIPIYKKGIKSDPSNYRPVSILCVLLKAL